MSETPQGFANADLNHAVADEVRAAPDQFREAGAWLDSYLPGSKFDAFEAAMWDVMDEVEDAGGDSHPFDMETACARKVLLLHWLATDRVVGKPPLHVTAFEDWEEHGDTDIPDADFEEDVSMDQAFHRGMAWDVLAGTEVDMVGEPTGGEAWKARAWKARAWKALSAIKREKADGDNNSVAGRDPLTLADLPEAMGLVLPVLLEAGAVPDGGVRMSKEAIGRKTHYRVNSLNAPLAAAVKSGAVSSKGGPSGGYQLTERGLHLAKST